MSRPDPTDWANKRKVIAGVIHVYFFDVLILHTSASLILPMLSNLQAAMERAKQLKEDRKKGTGMDESEHTFAPQINSRPSYLNKPTNDSLDLLASNSSHYSNDTMEQPLPGNKPQVSSSNSRDNNFQRPTPSPGSDALGNEMKKFPARDKSTTSSSSRPNNGQYQYDQSSGHNSNDRDSNGDNYGERENYNDRRRDKDQYNDQNDFRQQNNSQSYQRQQNSNNNNSNSGSQNYNQSNSRSSSGPQSEADSHNTTTSYTKNIVSELSSYNTDFESILRQESFSKKAGPGW